MNKREALEVLIQHSFIFTEGERQQLLAKAGTMSDETVENLAKFFALAKSAFSVHRWIAIR